MSGGPFYTLQHAAAHCNTPQHAATHCNTLQHNAAHAAHCSTLQHTATHCNTLQHTAAHAAHCNTLQRNTNLEVVKRDILDVKIVDDFFSPWDLRLLLPLLQF